MSVFKSKNVITTWDGDQLPVDHIKLPENDYIAQQATGFGVVSYVKYDTQQVVEVEITPGISTNDIIKKLLKDAKDLSVKPLLVNDTNSGFVMVNWEHALIGKVKHPEVDRKAGNNAAYQFSFMLTQLFE